MIVYYLIVVIGVLLASVSQILLKKSAAVEHTSFITEYLNVKVISGYALLVLSLGLDLWAMPILSLSKSAMINFRKKEKRIGKKHTSQKSLAVSLSVL